MPDVMSIAFLGPPTPPAPRPSIGKADQKMTAPAIKYEDKRPRHVAASQWSAVGAPHSAEQVRLADLLYPLALAHRSGRSALLQSGMAEIFFSRSSTSASFRRPGTRSDGKPGSTSTLASALANVSRDMA